jgi:hypothetical protein
MIALLIGQNPHAEGVWSSASWQISFFGVIVQIVFSICLILGARNVSGWILRFRANRVNK